MSLLRFIEQSSATAYGPAFKPVQMKFLSEGYGLVGRGFNPDRIPFTRAKIEWALQAAEKLSPVKGTGFSPYINPAKSARALAPEGCFSGNLLRIRPFSAACSARASEARANRLQPPREALAANYLPSAAKAADRDRLLMVGLKARPLQRASLLDRP